MDKCLNVLWNIFKKFDAKIIKNPKKTHLQNISSNINNLPKKFSKIQVRQLKKKPVRCSDQ